MVFGLVSEKKRIIVLGSNGTIGSNLLLKLKRAGHEAVSVSRLQTNSDFEHHQSDFLTEEKFEYLYENIDYAFITFASLPNEKEYRNTNNSKFLNVDVTLKVISILANLGIKVGYFSSAAVFDGKARYNKHEALVNPTTIYGEQKVLVERYLTDNVDNYDIFRTGKVIGNLRAVNSWHQDYMNQKRSTVHQNQYISPITVDFLVDSITVNFLQNEEKISQLSALDEISYLDVFNLFSAELERRGFGPLPEPILKTEFEGFESLASSGMFKNVINSPSERVISKYLKEFEANKQ